LRSARPVTRPWLTAALGLAGLALIALFTPLVLGRNICAFVPCDPIAYGPLGVTLADDRRTVQVAWPRCPGGGTIQEVRVEQPQSQDGQRQEPMVLWHLQGSVAGTRPVVFDVGRDHPGMRTATPLRAPLPAGQRLRVLLTTASTQDVGLLPRRPRVFTAEHDVAFRVADLRPGIVHWNERLDPGPFEARDDPRLRWSQLKRPA
jgi:hypothetical protein